MELYAEYNPKRLMPFLMTSQAYSLEAALQQCEGRGLVREQVFLLGRMGNSVRALDLIIQQLADIPGVSFVSDWHSTANYSFLLLPGLICCQFLHESPNVWQLLKPQALDGMSCSISHWLERSLCLCSDGSSHSLLQHSAGLDVDYSAWRLGEFCFVLDWAAAELQQSTRKCHFPFKPSCAHKHKSAAAGAVPNGPYLSKLRNKVTPPAVTPESWFSRAAFVQ